MLYICIAAMNYLRQFNCWAARKLDVAFKDLLGLTRGFFILQFTINSQMKLFYLIYV